MYNLAYIKIIIVKNSIIATILSKFLSTKPSTKIASKTIYIITKYLHNNYYYTYKKINNHTYKYTYIYNNSYTFIKINTLTTYKKNNTKSNIIPGILSAYVTIILDILVNIVVIIFVFIFVGILFVFIVKKLKTNILISIINYLLYFKVKFIWIRISG